MSYQDENISGHAPHKPKRPGKGEPMEILMEIFTDAELMDDDNCWGYIISAATFDKVREAVESK